MTARLVGVDLRQGEYIVGVYSQTLKGIWVLDGTPIRLAEDLSAGQLGDEVLRALERSRVGVPDVPRDSDVFRPWLDLLRLPDYATYLQGTRSVWVPLHPSARRSRLLPMSRPSSWGLL